MYDRVLVAVDGSDHANRAVQAAAELAKASKGQVYVLHVELHDVSKHFTVAPIETDPQAQGVVDRAVGELTAAGVRASGDVEKAHNGRAGEAILEHAKNRDADVIVVGSRGRSEVVALLVGSVADKVIRHADLPVLVVR